MARGGWLVLGGSGLVGCNCLAVLKALGVDAVATSFRNAGSEFIPVDVSDGAALKDLVSRVAPTVVLYCAGATAVDRCEEQPAWAMRLNAEAVAEVAAALPGDSLLVYVSSDYVFDGSSGPYSEEEPPRPINVYGQTKLAGEEAARSHPSHLVVRTTVVYGWELRTPPKNSLGQLVSALEEGRPFRAPADEVGTPTYAPDLADALVRLALNGAVGLYHVAGPDWVSRYEYARRAAVTFGLDPGLVLPVRSDDLGRPARRPREHGLVSTRAEAALGRPTAGLRDGLERARRRWFP